jgi:hypothetical protein
MRWLLSLVVPLVLLLVQAADAGAQDNPVTGRIPVTVTLDAATNVTAIEFPDLAPDERFLRPDSGQIQYLVGLLAPSRDGRYQTEVVYYTGNHGRHWDVVVFQREAVCAEPGVTEGTIQRIACSVVKSGEALACSATYDRMNEPPEVCTGTYSCIRCAGGVKICGANPDCVD